MSDYHDEAEAHERMASQAMRPYWTRRGERQPVDWVRRMLRWAVVLTVALCALGWWAGR